jgi:hypothetical protein
MSKAKGKAAVVEEVPAEPTNGNGEFSMPDKSTYNGDWSELAGVKTRNGRGIYTIGRDRYEGEWVNDAMEGAGEFTFGSGAVYRGFFKNNLFHGEGEYIFPNGSKYSGGWHNNKMHGNGTYTDASGLATTGDFVNGVYCSGEITQPFNAEDLPH